MTTTTAPSLPQLQAIKQSSGDLNEQIQQVAHIIGFPTDWESLSGESRDGAIQRLVRARADWVLRWIVEKWKDASDDGARARANPRAWRLLDCMIQNLPISRCAPSLRDAHFVTILEQTMSSFGADALQSSPRRAESDSSETVQEDPQPSRKRKRGSTGTNTPSKRAALETSAPAKLFDAVTTVIQSIRTKAQSQESSEGLAQAEHMHMVLKTESAQAASVLKYWLNALQQLNSAGTSPTTTQLDLSHAIEIWELRTIETKDSGASAEEFATECLVPTLLLLRALQDNVKLSGGQSEASLVLRHATTALEQLVARHVLAPARAAFLNPTTSTEEPERNLLSNSLAPLRAKILQAAQIEDTGEPIPTSFLSLFSAVPQLLDLAIRSSPARSRKSRVMERPWIQAAFVTLAECAGCALEAPEFQTPKATIDALRECLRVLASHDVNIESNVLKDLFWFHSGFKFPLRGTRFVHWPLIASMVKLDPDIFLTDPRSTWHTTQDKPNDLANFLFDQISEANFEPTGLTNGDRMEIDGPSSEQPELGLKEFGKDDVVDAIIVPIISAFARNRDLLGFISRWDEQLGKTTQTTRPALEQPIWKDHRLSKALATHFEQSLTPTQISNLFRDHAKRFKSHVKGKKGPSKDTHSNITIALAMLQSVTSDEVIDILQPHLHSLWSSFTSSIQDDKPSAPADTRVAWMALSQLLLLLWPIYFQASPSSQKEQLYPLIEQASKYVGSARKEEAGKRVDTDSHATAMAFLLAACDCIRSLPGTQELIQKRLRRAFKSLSPDHLEIKELTYMLEIFCADYVHLLEAFEPDVCRTLFCSLLSTISKLEETDAKNIVAALSQSVFTHGGSSLQTSYTSMLPEAGAHQVEHLHTLVATSLLQITPSSISRELREAILDNILIKLISRPRKVDTLLSIMVLLMEVPNATAQISSDGDALFNLAQSLHEAELVTSASLQLLQSLTQLTLSHIVPNKDQTQNMRFLEDYTAEITSATKKTQNCFLSRFALLRGTFLAAPKENELFPIDRYFAFLVACLEDEAISAEYILKAFNDIPLSFLEDNSKAYGKAQVALRKWTTSKLSSNGELSSLDVTTFATLPIKFWPILHGAIGRYQLCANDQSYLTFSSDLLRQSLPAEDKATVLNSVQETFDSLTTERKLALLPLCFATTPDAESPVVPCRMLHALVSSTQDKQAPSTLKQQQSSILPTICSLLEECRDDPTFNTLLDSIITILRHKPSLTTQHGIECVIVALSKLTSRNSPRLSPDRASAIFTRLCDTTRLILVLQRGRIGGRFHMLLPLLQGLLLCLFIPNAGRGAALPPWLDSFAISNPVRLTPANASSFTRLLSTLCSPTQSSVQRHRSTSSMKKEYVHHIIQIVSPSPLPPADFLSQTQRPRQGRA
jgi:nucleolar pre-ribosomal-associated protein 2